MAFLALVTIIVDDYDKGIAFFVDALGLRPTASDALPPIRPTPMAAPRAARPTHKFPFMISVFSSRRFTLVQSAKPPELSS